MLVTDLLAQPSVAYDNGDILSVFTASTGFAPSNKSTQNYVKGQYNFKIKGVGTPSVAASAEVDTLTVTAAAAASGNVVVTLNGVAVTVAVAASDTTSQVATKIAAANYSATGFTAGASGAVVTFTASAVGPKAAPTYSAGSTGATGSFVVTNAGTMGTYPQYNIVPIVPSADTKTLVDDDANPVVIQTTGKVIYATGRNDVAARDVYHSRQYNTISSITAGQEARTALVQFLLFVQSEYSIGVNTFITSAATYTD